LGITTHSQRTFPPARKVVRALSRLNTQMPDDWSTSGKPCFERLFFFSIISTKMVEKISTNKHSPIWLILGLVFETASNVGAEHLQP
jgi:hypothetical protein